MPHFRPNYRQFTTTVSHQQPDFYVKSALNLFSVLAQPQTPMTTFPKPVVNWRVGYPIPSLPVAFDRVRFTYIATEAAYAASLALCVKDKAVVQPQAALTDFCLQPYSRT